jgi:hypothetical protein
MNKPKKIFVLGYGRSGTTMMGTILGKHPEIYMFRELNFFEKVWDRRGRQELTEQEAVKLAARLAATDSVGFFMAKDLSEFEEKGREIVSGIQAEVITPLEVYEAFLSAATAEHGKRFPCEQTPGYVFFIPEILRLFPEARIINMIRDPRANLNSRKNKWRQFRYQSNRIPSRRTLRHWAHYHPISSSFLWRRTVTAAQPYVDSGQILQVRFESVLSDPEKELRRICDFIGVDYHDSMQQVPVVGSSFTKPDPEKLGIDKSKASKWQEGGLNSAELFFNQAINADIIRAYGYERVKVFPNPLLLLYYLVSLPFRMLLSFALHGPQFKNMPETLKKRFVWGRTMKSS